MAESFGDFVGGRLRSRGISVREFARMTGHQSAHSFVSRVLRGVRPPPLKALEAWARALDITADERDRFDELAALAHSPPMIRERFETMREKLAAKARK